MDQPRDAHRGNDQQHYQQQGIDQARTDVTVAEKGVFRMRIELRILQNVFQALTVELRQAAVHLGADGGRRCAGRQVEDGIAKAYQTRSGEVRIEVVLIHQGEGLPDIGVSGLEDGADVGHHAHHTSFLEVQQQLLAHRLGGSAVQLTCQALADDNETPHHAVLTIADEPPLVIGLLESGATGIVFSLCEGTARHETVAKEVEPVGSHGTKHHRLTVGRSGQSTDRFAQSAMPRQLVHAGQVVEEGGKGRRPQGAVAPHVRTVGTHALGAVVVEHAAASGFRSHVRRAEVVDHDHYHDEGDGHRRAHHAHRRVEAVLAQQAEERTQVM